MTMRLSLQKIFHSTFITLYALTMSNTKKVKKKQYYSHLRDTINCVLADDRL